MSYAAVLQIYEGAGHFAWGRKETIKRGSGFVSGPECWANIYFHSGRDECALYVWDTVGPGWLDFKGGVRAEAGRAVLLSTFLFKKWAYVTGYGNIFLWLFLSWKLSVIN